MLWSYSPGRSGLDGGDGRTGTERAGPDRRGNVLDADHHLRPGAWGVPMVLLAWGVRFMTHRGEDRALGRMVFAVIAVALGSVFAATHVPDATWTHSFGLGGLFGDTILGALLGVAPVGGDINNR